MLKEIIKTELQSYGVRLSGPGVEGRLGGAGPAEGITFSLDGTILTAPAYSGYAERSPYRIHNENSSYYLYCLDNLIGPVYPVNNRAFNSCVTSDGHPYSSIALIHGKDCLASTVLQDCSYWGKAEACAFCGIGLSIKSGLTIGVKTPSQLAEVAVASLDKGVRHLLLTSGSSPGGKREINHISACVKALKSATGLPVQVQCMPPRDHGLLGMLRDSGADSIGLHAESADDDVLARIAPVKASTGWDGYLECWSKAVELFGRGQVTSYLIMGLGERLSHTLARVEEMTGLGVYPFIVPLRPVPGTPAGDLRPPPPDVMTFVYKQTADILALSGLRSADIKAGCGRCSACSALPDYEERRQSENEVVCRPASCAEELREAMVLRRRVFVEEQGVFNNTDEDEYDPEAIHLVASEGNRVVGTVRLYHDSGDVWFGGRLAISPLHRQNGIGPLLVKTAVKEARERGAIKFLAWVQEQNESFFKDLGWKRAGERKSLSGCGHLLMKAF